jgi:uncharacterized protein (TIGR02996 family)
VTERESLLAAIIAQPDEDTVRLAFADWLDEHGEHARAEFVRVQCELARTPGCRLKVMPREYYLADGRVMYESGLDCGGCVTCVRRSVLGNRERELLDGGRDYEWFFPRGVFAWETRWQYRRGFVHAVTCTAADFLAHGDAIRAAHPVRSVTLTSWPDLWRPAADDAARAAYRAVLEAGYPGITFHLPPEPVLMVPAGFADVAHLIMAATATPPGS